MNARPSDRLAIAVAQLNSTVGDIAGNVEKVRRARATRRRAGRRSRRLSRTVHRRLSARGPGAEAGVPGRLPRRHGRPRPRDRDARSGAAGRRAVARWRQALQRGRLARRRHHRRAALQGRPAELRRVRREARFRRRADAGPGQFPRRAARRSDLRRHLERGSRRVPGRDRRRDAGGAERFAVLAAEGRRPHQHRGGARHRAGAADGLRQPDRRPGRTGVRRRVVRPACRLLAGLPALRFPGNHRHHAMGARRRHLALRERSDGRQRRGRPRRLCRLRAGPARLRQQERLSRRGAGSVRRHRLGAVRRHCRRCAWARSAFAAS